MIHGLQPRLAEGGAIRIGNLGKERTSKKGNTFRMPQKLDHFILTKPERDAAGNLVQDKELTNALEKDESGKLVALPIVLHSDDIEEIMPSALALYTGRVMACRGDGQTAVRYEVKDKRKTGRSTPCECPCRYMRNSTRNQLGIKELLTPQQDASAQRTPCKPHATFHCSVMAPGQAVAGAVHKWRTTSIISISHMRASLEHIKQAVGTLRGVPLWLRVKPVQVTPADAPASTVYCCHLELRESDVMRLQDNALRAAEVRRALQTNDPQGYKQLVAPPAIDEDSIVEAEVQQEFSPGADEGFGPFEEAMARIGAARDQHALLEIGRSMEGIELDEKQTAELRAKWKSRREELPT